MQLLVHVLAPLEGHYMIYDYLPLVCISGCQPIMTVYPKWVMPI